VGPDEIRYWYLRQSLVFLELDGCYNPTDNHFIPTSGTYSRDISKQNHIFKDLKASMIRLKREYVYSKLTRVKAPCTAFLKTLKQAVILARDNRCSFLVREEEKNPYTNHAADAEKAVATIVYF
jgi:hypothetical protein